MQLYGFSLKVLARRVMQRMYWFFNDVYFFFWKIQFDAIKRFM